jgi:hypothetical protein
LLSNKEKEPVRTHQIVGASVLLAALTSSTLADNVVVPNANAATPGTAGLNTLLRDLPRTYQMIIDDSHLAGIPVGSTLTGVQWRAFITAQNPATWPAVDFNYTDYDMFIGQAALPVGGGSTTFANNVVGGSNVQVLDGPLTIPAGSFSQGTLPNPSPWGHLISFDTGFVYNGGDIVFTAIHPGGSPAPALFLDAVASGVATGVQTFTATTAGATTGAASTSIIFNFSYTPIPAPSALALLSLAGLVGGGRRRRA